MRLRSVQNIAWPVSIWCAAAAVFFRDFLSSGFDAIAGDPGDVRFGIFVRENFYLFLRGAAEFASPPMFFPARNTLGYSDGYLLDALVYVPSRALGADPFLSFELVCIALTLIGFASFNILVTRYGRARQPVAALVAVLFSFSNALFIKIGHPQMEEVNILPVVAILMLEAGRRSGQRFGRMAPPAFFGGLLLALLYSTGYYVAWFFSVLAAMTLLASLAIDAGPNLIRRLSGLARAYSRTAWVVLAGFAIGLIPFLRMYLPVLGEHPGRVFGEYLFFAPTFADIVNVGRENLFWGDAMDRLLTRSHFETAEVDIATTPIVLATYLLCVFGAWRGRLLVGREDRALRAAVLGSFVALLIFWVVTIKVGSISLFWLAWHVLPGASAIRTGGRELIVANAVVAAVIAIIVSRLWRDATTLARKLLIAGLLVVCVAEQINVRVNHGLSRAAQMAFLGSVPSPPVECRSFFLIATPPRNRHNQQVDAMLIAQTRGIPTLNGYSGWDPAGWSFADANKRSYKPEVWDWARRRHVTDGLCSYRIASSEWSLIRGGDEMQQPESDQDDSALPPALTRDMALDLRAGGNAAPHLVGNWSTPEELGRWTDGARAGLAISVADWNGDMVLVVTGRPFLVAQRQPRLAIRVEANGSPVATWIYLIDRDDASVTRTARIPAAMLARSPLLRIDLQIDQPASPLEMGVSDDGRKLGLFVSQIDLHP